MTEQPFLPALISSRSAHYADIARALDNQRAEFAASLRALGSTSLVSALAEQSARQLRAFSRIPIPAFPSPMMLQSATAVHAMLESINRSTTLALQAQQAERLRLIDRTFADMARPALEASRVFEAMRSLAIAETARSSVTALKAATLRFAQTASSAMTSLAQNPDYMLRLPEWLQRAPGAEQYAAAQVISSVDSSAGEARDTDTDLQLDAMGQQLESRLAGVDSAFVEVYRGAIAPLHTQGPDWRRHVATSVRELVDHLLRRLAPDDELRSFHAANPAAIEDGEFTRRARLQYVFREIAVGEYARMADEDIGATLATFYPANATVHVLVSGLTPAQVRVYLRRVQGCISTFLEAAGY